MIYIKTPGKKMWGYRCEVCGQEILSDEELSDLSCSCCGSRMVCTNIPKERERQPEESSGGGVASPCKKKPSPDGCQNCVYSRKSIFETEDGEFPGYRCFKDNRTHSPDAKCYLYSRRGRRNK